MKQLWTVVLCGFAATSWAAAPIVAPLCNYGGMAQAPARVATDAAGNLYVADTDAGRIMVFDEFGRLTAKRGGILGPMGIAVDAAGRIYVGEEKTGSVSVFDAQWNLLYQLGAGAHEFQMPNYIAIDADNNSVYVSDSLADVIRIYSGPTRIGQLGGTGSGDGKFVFPAGICVSHQGEVFVVDQGNDRAQVFDRAGRYLRKIVFGGKLGPSGRKQGAAVDNAGRLYVVDAYQGLVRVYDTASGSLLSSLSGYGASAGQLKAPGGVALDRWGRLFVASLNNARVELFGLDSFVHLSTSAGDVIAAGSSMVFSVMTGGAGPAAIQWLKDGVAIEGATGPTLSVDRAGTGDTGGYSVTVNGMSSSVASVSVLDPPQILAGPQGATVRRGAAVTFAVDAAGTSVSYQWQFNGQNIPGATNSVLALAGVQAVHSGSYAVLVQNAVGSVTSISAQLRVLVPPSVLEILSLRITPSLPCQVTVSADPGASLVLEASDNLVEWQVLTNFVNESGLMDLIDADGANAVQRFYRVRWAP